MGHADVLRPENLVTVSSTAALYAALERDNA
jgi:hypothetical protein